MAIKRFIKNLPRPKFFECYNRRWHIYYDDFEYVHYVKRFFFVLDPLEVKMCKEERPDDIM